MEKINLLDLVNIRSALRVHIESYSKTQYNTDRKEETLEKIDELISRYNIDDKEINKTVCIHEMIKDTISRRDNEVYICDVCGVQF